MGIGFRAGPSSRVKFQMIHPGFSAIPRCLMSTRADLFPEAFGEPRRKAHRRGAEEAEDAEERILA